MKISIVTVFEQLYAPFLGTSLLKRAQEKGLVQFELLNFFSLVPPKERIDAPTFGHGAGMLIRPEVVQRAVEQQESRHGRAFRIFFSPQGKKLTQPLLAEIYQKAAAAGHCMLIPARYEGMDARVEKEYADAVISVGDFVLMGGDIPAMMLLEGMLRLMPGVVGKQSSVEHDSFGGPFFDHPEYSEPVVWQGHTVPDVIRSGNHKEIMEWRKKAAVEKTVKERFDWVRSRPLSAQDASLIRNAIPPHGVVLMHSEVMVGSERQVGTTSVTSIDIHDIARSSYSYGMEQFFIVTPLLDQQRIVERFLGFWHHGSGVTYNPTRHEALRSVTIKSSLDAVCVDVEEKTGKKPLLIGTSARAVDHPGAITFDDHAIVWEHQRPVLFILGTGQGLAPELIARLDYVLAPLYGLVPFNHLSVRSAAAIIFDRWLGVKEKKS